MSRFSDLAKAHLAKLAIAAASAPDGATSEPEPERIIPAVDPVTRAARDRMKALTMGRPGSPVYFDEMTDEEIRQWRRRNRMAMIPLRNPWLDPLGERRSIWDREI
jgi:hypothetical protein